MLPTEIVELSQKEYELFRDLIYQQVGINLGDSKAQLVRSRLGKRLRDGKFRNYREYYDYVKRDATGRELEQLIDAISTNTTHLFRENRHFEFLTETLRKWCEPGRQHRAQIRIWSAACSSGEEPYSIAMTVDDVLRARKGVVAKIVATDISTRVLEKARAAVYSGQQLANVPADFQKRYFKKVTVDGEARHSVCDELRRMITFQRYNLMSDAVPIQGGVDVIFCRNVMIYFDRPTQEKLVNKLARALTPGGYLLIGHSESLNNISHPLTYVMPTTYQKPA